MRRLVLGMLLLLCRLNMLLLLLFLLLVFFLFRLLGVFGLLLFLFLLLLLLFLFFFLLLLLLFLFLFILLLGLVLNFLFLVLFIGNNALVSYNFFLRVWLFFFLPPGLRNDLINLLLDRLHIFVKSALLGFLPLADFQELILRLLLILFRSRLQKLFVSSQLLLVYFACVFEENLFRSSHQ